MAHATGAPQISRYALLRQYPIGAREGTSPLELNIGAALVAAPLNLSVSGQECRCDVQGLSAATGIISGQTISDATERGDNVPFGAHRVRYLRCCCCSICSHDSGAGIRHWRIPHPAATALLREDGAAAAGRRRWAAILLRRFGVFEREGRHRHLGRCGQPGDD